MSRSLPGGWLESGHGSVMIFVKDFRDPLERRKKLLLRPWASIKDIKDQLQVVFNVPSNAQKLFFQGRELKNTHSLQQCGIYQDNAVVDFVARRPQNISMVYTRECDEQNSAAVKRRNCGEESKLKNSASAYLHSKTSQNLRPEQVPVVNIQPYGTHLLPVALLKIMHQALQGLALGLAPVLAMDGTGGTYFFKDPSHRNVCCFKPQDEEPFGPNNPRGLVGQLGQNGLRRGILSGEACERELAAYILDKDHFAGVPPTSLVESRHPVFNYTSSSGAIYFKVGSLQEFVRHDDVVSDLSPNQFSIHQVHKIVLLDMRLLSTDRNDANILVRKRRSQSMGHAEFELIPIDHGYCLPQFLEIGWCDWCWFNWPQLQHPLSAGDRAYILSLSPQDDVARLAERIPLRRACRRNIIIASMTVQKGVRANLILFEIARIMCREDLDTLSTLEQLCIKAFSQLQVIKQRKQNGTHLYRIHIPQSIASAAEESEPIVVEEETESVLVATRPSQREAFQNLRLIIDSPSCQHSSRFGRSPIASGAHSPPGFWANNAPFSTNEDDEFQECCVASSDTENGLNADKSNRSRFLLNWDKSASNALIDAAQQVGSKSTGSLATSASAACNGSTIFSEYSSSRSPAFSIIDVEDDKDEFEMLNDALDGDVQDENLFLSILGRLLDERIDILSGN
ncbi:hypothetical protein CCR75_007690 [Bremia lactucae]|uniref:1-phosphatidylinositol 4-kinase n=1 Tax=Bremia lactucae TaxID=4779 RepID=A0A976FPT3_BRELC|nr:hypothetical protein CCR75_007690 [Bremia lactucae]